MTELTLKQIRDAIPEHLFRQNTSRSFGYLFLDLIKVVVTAATMVWVLQATTSWLHLVLWPAYWWIQGLNGTALWVLAHECGHQAFSPSRAINDTVGFILHSALLVPYHSWRITHGNHHKHTNHIDKDTVFVPNKEDAPLKEAVEESPLVSLITIFMMLTIGWPGYLFANFSGQKYSRRANHFEPSSPLFRSTEQADVVLSNIGIIAVVTFLSCLSYVFGFKAVAAWYGVPYLFVNMWLVLITYLQHTDARVVHYSAKEWNFVRGALCTVDRDYGICNSWFHHITDSHVAHHLFSTMPFYNAIQATQHLKPVLGKLYLYDNTPIVRSLWRSWRSCRYVVVRDDVQRYYS
jgi:omega-6 fatty acid desaturase (delta-12 desaturase)